MRAPSQTLRPAFLPQAPALSAPSTLSFFYLGASRQDNLGFTSGDATREWHRCFLGYRCMKGLAAFCVIIAPQANMPSMMFQRPFISSHRLRTFWIETWARSKNHHHSGGGVLMIAHQNMPRPITTLRCSNKGKGKKEGGCATLPTIRLT